MSNDVIVKLTMEFFEEAKKNPYKNIQKVVSVNYNLWYQDGGLADVLENAGLGVYKVIAAILNKAGYENASEDYVGRCVRKHEERLGLKSPKTEPVPAAGVITRKVGTSPVDRGVAVPGGHSPSGGSVARVEVLPDSNRENSLPVATSTNPSSSSVGWWDVVAQKLGIEIKKVSPDFNFFNTFISVNRQNMNYEDSDIKEPYPDYSSDELELIGGILYLCKDKGIEENLANKSKQYFYNKEAEKAVSALITKCDRLKTIIRFNN
ncbi:TPA: hypothetical protein MYP09_001444 [Citrobacter farmeri]|nr:hypothetical protein [Citrobacter farmeri]